LLPPFTPDQDGSDWNDLARLLGTEFKKVLRDAFAAAERRLAASSGRGEEAAEKKVSARVRRIAGSR
jgi:hypothetical protein